MSGTDLRAELEPRARGDLAALCLVAGVLLAATLRDVSAGLPQVAAAACVLFLGSGAERLALRLPGRLALLVACAAYGWLPGGAPPAVLARFTAAVVAGSLVKPKATREQGFLLLVVLVQVALAAALETRFAAAPMALVLAVLAHRALGSWHRLRAATRVQARHGVLFAVGEAKPSRRAADRAAFACVTLAVPLFFVLPRTDLAVLALPGVSSASEPGVGEEVRLGRLGPIADPDELVGRAQPLDEGARDLEPYFRAVALEDFDGVRWSTVSGDEKRAFEYGTTDPRVQMPHVYAVPTSPRFLCVIESSASPRLPLPEHTAGVWFHDPVPRTVLRDEAGCLRPEMERSVPRLVYEVVIGRPDRRVAAPPASTAALPPKVLVDELRPEIERVLAAVPPTDLRRKADALTTWIRSTCRYSLEGAPGGKDPVGDFLLRVRQGHCEYFASALAASLRIAGIPARLVAGYHASGWNETGAFWALRRRDAHAWVEAWLPDEGWTRFDATPSAALEHDPYAGALGFLARWRDAASFAWNRHVIGYDPAAQREMAESLRDAVRGLLSSLSGPVMWAGASACALLGFLPWAWRRARRTAARSRARVGRPTASFYRRALAALARRGLVRRPDETAAELLARARPNLSPPAADALGGLTGAFEACRYGEAGTPPDPAVDAWIRTLATG